MPETIMAAPVALPMQLRRAPILPATVNTEARSVDVVFTTGAAVRRRRWTGWDTSVPFDEILEINTDARHLALQVALLVTLLASVIGVVNAFRMMRLPDPVPTTAADGMVLG